MQLKARVIDIEFQYWRPPRPIFNANGTAQRLERLDHLGQRHALGQSGCSTPAREDTVLNHIQAAAAEKARQPARSRAARGDVDRAKVSCRQ